MAQPSLVASSLTPVDFERVKVGEIFYHLEGGALECFRKVLSGPKPLTNAYRFGVTTQERRRFENSDMVYTSM
jgi:hypothetical protein